MASVIIKLPRMSKWMRGRIRGFERVPGRFEDRHIYKGRQLSVEEFNACAEKVLGDDTLSHRLVVEILPDDAAPAASAEDAPTVEDAKAMLAEIDRLREQNEKLRAVVDGIGTAAAVDEHAGEPDPERPVVAEPEAVTKKKGKK